MAELIVDALVTAKLIDKARFEEAVEIAEEEMEVRLWLNDPIVKGQHGQEETAKEAGKGYPKS